MTQKTGRRSTTDDTETGAKTPASPKEALGDQLKSMFDSVAAQPLPDEIESLVEELERKRLAGELPEEG